MSARLRLHVKLKARAAWNWLHGYAFSAVMRCRDCDHTIYPSERPCPYCPARSQVKDSST